MSDERQPSIFSPPRNDAPWWVVPILTFFLGVAITVAVLLPAGPDAQFLAGRKAGYAAGLADAEEFFNRGYPPSRHKFIPKPVD